MRRLLVLLGIFMLVSVFVGFGSGKEEVAEGKIITLTMIGDAGHNVLPLEWYNDIFKEKFGVTVEVVEVPFGELYEKSKIEYVAKTGAFDFAIVFPKFVGEFAQAGFLLNLDDFAKKLDPNMGDVTPGYRDFYCKFGADLYAVPFDGDVLSLYYRKDLFENEAEKAAFMAEFGYELTAPATWDQYLDVAKFFYRKTGEKLAGETLGRPFYGTAFYGQKDQIFAWWGNRFASMGGGWFDEGTMKPDVLAYGYEELKDVFLNGDCAMVIQWPCVGKKGADPEQSQVVGKIGASKVPGVSKAGKIYARALMPCGRVLAVAADSKHQWEAYQVIHYLTTATSLDDVSTPLTGLDPYRYSHFDNPAAFEMFPTENDAALYLAGVQENMEIGYPELVIPGAVEYEETLGVWLMKAIAGEASAKSALDSAAAEWEDITARFGVDKQKKLYQALVAGWRAAGLW